MENSKLRIIVLSGLVVMSAIFFVLTIIPDSPFIKKNVCMENEKAAKIEASADAKAKAKYIEKRNEDCKTLLKYAKKPETTYDKIDTCNMVDSVVAASNSYIKLHKDDKRTINEELNYLTKNITKYSFCPQYKEVVQSLIEAKKQVQ